MNNLEAYRLAGIHPKRRTYPSGVVRLVPTTAQLRRGLHDPATPREARCLLYAILLHRRRSTT